MGAAVLLGIGEDCFRGCIPDSLIEVGLRVGHDAGRRMDNDATNVGGSLIQQLGNEPKNKFQSF